MDACVQVLEQGDYTGVADYGVLPLLDGHIGSTHKVDGATVSLVVQKHPRDDTIFACTVQGLTWGDEDSIRNPGLTWGEAGARIRTWFEAQMAKPGHAEITKGAREGPYYGVSCSGAGEGFFIRFGPGVFGSKTTGVADDDVAFVFWAVRSANKPEQACELYTRYRPGG